MDPPLRLQRLVEHYAADHKDQFVGLVLQPLDRGSTRAKTHQIVIDRGVLASGRHRLPFRRDRASYRNRSVLNRVSYPAQNCRFALS